MQGNVSVPYRGATFLNYSSWSIGEINSSCSFRPLSGSYISQLQVQNVGYRVICFRPLSGSYISQYENDERNEKR